MAYAVINKETHEKHVQALLELASTPGLQRSRAVPVLKELGGRYALRVSYGRGVAQIAGNGSVYAGVVDEHAEEIVDKNGNVVAPQVTHDDPAGMEVGLATPLSKVVIAGSAPMNKAIDTIHIPCGICVIVAKGGAGKTPLAHHLAGTGVDEYATIRVGEPFAGYTTNRNTVARDLGRAMVTHSDIVLDSIKDLLAGGGSAMKGGIARDALTDLSAWAIQAAALGTTIYVPLNPSGDAELVELMTEVAKSNATMTISHLRADEWGYSSRTGEGMERVSGIYRFTRTASPQTRTEREMLVKFDASNVSRDSFAGLLQRSRSI